MQKKDNLYIPVQELLDATAGSIYSLVILVAKRALALADGEKPMVEKPSEKFLDTAIREIYEKKIKSQKVA